MPDDSGNFWIENCDSHLSSHIRPHNTSVKGGLLIGKLYVQKALNRTRKEMMGVENVIGEAATTGWRVKKHNAMGRR